MEQEHFQEWRDLEQIAQEMLRADDWRLRLSVAPSFENSLVIGIGTFSEQIVSGKKLRCKSPTMIRWRTWRREVDYEKFRSPVERLKHPKQLSPTLEERQLEIAWPRIEDFTRSLGTICIPALPHGPEYAGADGTRFDFSAQWSMHHCSYSWWSHYPLQWQPLTEWFARTWQLLADDLELSVNHRPSDFGSPYGSDE